MSNKKYNILLVHNFYQIPGGEDSVFYNEKKLLEENGHKVITYTRNNIELKKYNILKKILLPLTIIFNFKTYFDIKRIIKDNDIDIVHVHNTLSLISPSVFYASIKMKKPVVQTLHNFRMQCPNGLFYRDGNICEDCINAGLTCAIRHKCYRNSFIQTLAIVIMTKIHRFTGIYKKINFICLTEFNKQKLLLLNNRKQIIDENRIFIKPNFVFEVKNDKIKSIDTKGYYLYVGRLDEIKGIDTVLSAFSKMPSRELHVIGSSGERYIKEYSEYNNIKFLGQLLHDEVMKQMANGLALISASKCYETFGLIIIEAFCNKLPVISCDVGNISQLVKENINGVHFQNNSFQSLILAVDKFDKLNRAVLSQNAYEEYFEKFSSTKVYEALIKIYENLQDSINKLDKVYK